MHRQIPAEEIGLAASALSTDDVRGCDLPAVKAQLLAVITNLVSLSGKLSMQQRSEALFSS